MENGTQHSFVRHEFVVDTERDRVGEVMGFEGGRIQLRPPRGGREWDCRPEAVRAASRAEKLSAEVARANHRHRRW